jgi:hypothetical protein
MRNAALRTAAISEWRPTCRSFVHDSSPVRQRRPRATSMSRAAVRHSQSRKRAPPPHGSAIGGEWLGCAFWVEEGLVKPRDSVSCIWDWIQVRTAPLPDDFTAPAANYNRNLRPRMAHASGAAAGGRPGRQSKAARGIPRFPGVHRQELKPHSRARICRRFLQGGHIDPRSRSERPAPAHRPAGRRDRS